MAKDVKRYAKKENGEIARSEIAKSTGMGSLKLELPHERT